MPRELNGEQLRRLARLGAEARLEELRREAAAIHQAFPDLGRAGRGRSSRGSRARSNSRGRRSPMSASERRAVSLRMKKYWAVRRKAKAAK